MYVAESIAEDQSTHAHTALLLNMFKYSTSTYLATKDIHSLTSTFNTDTCKNHMGYFQGIVSAVVIAASGTFKEFVNNSKAIQWLFYSGLRGQQAFPVTSVEPSIVQDSIVGREGTPSPMLSKIPFYQQNLFSQLGTYSLEFCTTASTWTE